MVNSRVCIVQLFFYIHVKNEAGCCNGSWYIDCQRGNFTRVTSKIAASHTGKFLEKVTKLVNDVWIS